MLYLEYMIRYIRYLHDICDLMSAHMVNWFWYFESYRYALYAWPRELGHASWKPAARSSHLISWRYAHRPVSAQFWCKDRVRLARAWNTSVRHQVCRTLIRNHTCGLKAESSRGREAVGAAAVIRNKWDV